MVKLWTVIILVMALMAGCKKAEPRPYIGEKIGIQVNIKNLSPDTEKALLRIIDEAINSPSEE